MPATEKPNRSYSRRAASFDRRTSSVARARAEARPFAQHVAQQRRADAAPAMRRRDRQVVDVQLVEHAPERAEADDLPRRVARDVAERDAVVLELREIHLARPRIGERRVLDRENRVEVGRRASAARSTQLATIHAAPHRARSRRPGVARTAAGPRRGIDRFAARRGLRDGQAADGAGERRRHRRSPRATHAVADHVAIQHRAVADDARPAHVARTRPPRQRRRRVADRGPHRARQALGAERRAPRARDTARRTPRAGARPSTPPTSVRRAPRPRAASCASASSAETPATRRRRTNASPCIVAMPMRRPVNDPGPDATANRSTSASDEAARARARAGGRRAAAPRACATDRRRARRRRRSSSTSATLPARVVVSRASTRMR